MNAILIQTCIIRWKQNNQPLIQITQVQHTFFFFFSCRGPQQNCLIIKAGVPCKQKITLSSTLYHNLYKIQLPRHIYMWKIIIQHAYSPKKTSFQQAKNLFGLPLQGHDYTASCSGTPQLSFSCICCFTHSASLADVILSCYHCA